MPVAAVEHIADTWVEIVVAVAVADTRGVVAVADTYWVVVAAVET